MLATTDFGQGWKSATRFLIKYIIRPLCSSTIASKMTLSTHSSLMRERVKEVSYFTVQEMVKEGVAAYFQNSFYIKSIFFIKIFVRNIFVSSLCNE